MSSPLSIITVRAPEYLTEPNLIDLINEAENEVGNEYPTSALRNKAVALTVMHWIAIHRRSGSSGTSVSGAITSEKEGDLARSYGSVSSSGSGDSDLSQTAWGLELMRLNNGTLLGPRTRFI